MQLRETTNLKEIKQTNQTALTFCVILQTNKKPQNCALNKTLVYTRPITGMQFHNFFYLILQKEKNCGHGNSLLQHT